MNDRNSVFNRFFVGFFAVFVDVGLIFLAMRQTPGATNTAAQTRHPFDEIGIEHIFALFEKGHFARLDPVADGRFDGKIDVLLLEGFGDGIAQTATARKDAPKIRGHRRRAW